MNEVKQELLVHKFLREGILENGKNRQRRTFVEARRPFGDRKFEEVLPDYDSSYLIEADALRRLERFANGHMIHPLSTKERETGDANNQP